MIILRSHDQRTTDYFLGVDRDWIECKDRQLWIEIDHVTHQYYLPFSHCVTHPVPVYCVFIFYYINTVDVVHVATVVVLSSVKFILFERLIRNFIHIFLSKSNT